jgi:hypothetical protein
LTLRGGRHAWAPCAKSRTSFFFEKKKQKTFVRMAAAFPDRLSQELSKFFGSFFQKRTAF